MTNIGNKQSYPLGLVIFALALAVYKSAMLSVGSAAFWSGWAIFVGLDLFYLGFLLFLAVIFGLTKSRVLSVPLWMMMVFTVAIYLVDSFVLLALDDHADLLDIGRYALEDGVVLSFFDTSAYAAIGLLLLSLFLFSKFTKRLGIASIAFFVFALVTGVLTEMNATRAIARYAMLSPADVMESFAPRTAVSDYSYEQITFYAGLGQPATVIPATKPNIILVIVESLSSINSQKTSGVGNLLDGFDELTEEGLLFRNFFANHQASEGGVIALLGGYPPIHFPTATPYMFDEFAFQSSVVGEYQLAGYFTEFMTNSDLGFIGLNHFLDGLGFDRSRGRDEIASMRGAIRVVQDAPSDDLLYAEALSTQRQHTNMQSPYLMVLATTSTHLPYTHPEGGPETANAVWEWSLQQLQAFYWNLQKSNFFEDGILLITGDHRQMRRLTTKETDRYGGSARARVPLLLIGRDYPANTSDDRFFQQSDLLRYLGLLSQPDTTLSPHPIWVERYNRKYGRIELIDNLSVFDELDGGRLEYQLTVFGNQVEWLVRKPAFGNEIELQIHTQRSQHQKARQAME